MDGRAELTGGGPHWPPPPASTRPAHKQLSPKGEGGGVPPTPKSTGGAASGPAGRRFEAASGGLGARGRRALSPRAWAALRFPPGRSPEQPAQPGNPRARPRPVTIATARAPLRHAPAPRTPAPRSRPRGAHAQWAAGPPLAQTAYSQMAPSTPDRRHSQRYHHVMPSSCAGGAELTDVADPPPEPLMVPLPGAAHRPHKGLQSRPRWPVRCLVGRRPY